jgi:hypothetical protein
LKNKARQVKIFTPQLHLRMKPAEKVGPSEKMVRRPPPEIGNRMPADIRQEYGLNKALDSFSGSP